MNESIKGTFRNKTYYTFNENYIKKNIILIALIFEYFYESLSLKEKKYFIASLKFFCFSSNM